MSGRVRSAVRVGLFQLETRGVHEDSIEGLLLVPFDGKERILAQFVGQVALLVVCGDSGECQR